MRFIRHISFLLLYLVALVSCAQNSGQGETTQDEETSSDKHRLQKASSPYLQQHADNPVDWYEWGPEALEKAKKENKPLLISIGYAACHWCHVMEHESFMDMAVARVMNEHFISIKIDREERPDIDQIYMEAAQMINGSGGWPLNAFALPDGRPFYAGTYFPKNQWTELLLQLSSLYKNEHPKVVEQAELITQGIISQGSLVAPVDSEPDFSKQNYQAIFANWEPIIDYKKGGYGRTPKFPIPIGWEFLLQCHYLTGEKKALDAVTTTLDAMAKGGIYDQIGGGFARYSTDEDWFAPHFEKMLYDNGQLVSLYAHAYKVTKNETYAEVVRETLAFIKREMTEPTGGFYSSLNADSEGEEGTFYVWKEGELQSALGESDYPIFKEYFQVTQQGNWESGNNILHRKYDKKDFAKKKGMTEQQWESKLAAAKKDLLELRAKRERPSTDDKVLTAWNALMLKGYVDAFLALGETAYLETAISNAHFLEKNMLLTDGALWRSYKDGEAGIEAFLDDYSLLADAYITLYQATLDIHWLQLSKKITDHAILHFRDKKSGLFYYTSDRAESLIARKMELSDNVIPSSNSVMAQVLFRLGEYYQEPAYTDMSREMLHQMEKDIVTGGPYMANWAMLLGLVAYGPNEVAIMGENANKISQEMQQNYLPTSLFMGGDKENLPLLENKLQENSTIIYVCRNRTCKLPVRSVEKALGLITK